MDLIAGDSVANQIIVFGEFEPKLTQQLIALAKDGYSFIDIGCNVGYFSCIWAQHAQHSVILAVDANPQMCETTRNNGMINDFKFTVENTAITLEEEDVTLSWPKNALSHASLGAFSKPAESIQVKGKPLSKLLKDKGWNRTSVLKVDIEGYEIPLLQSLNNYDHVLLPHILFEVCPENYERCGFTIEQLWDIGWLKNYSIEGFSSKGDEIIPLSWGSQIPKTVDTLWAKHHAISRH